MRIMNALRERQRVRQLRDQVRPGCDVNVWVTDWLIGGCDGWYPATVVSVDDDHATVDARDLPGQAVGVRVMHGALYLVPRPHERRVRVPLAWLHMPGTGPAPSIVPVVTLLGGGRP